MTRPRSLALAGLATALLANFWLLEDWLAARTDLSDAWISDLAARTQVYGWRFQLLEIAAGLAVAAYAALLLRATAEPGRAARPSPAPPRPRFPACRRRPARHRRRRPAQLLRSPRTRL